MSFLVCSLNNKIDQAHCFYTGVGQVDSEGKRLFLYTRVKQSDPNIHSFVCDDPKLYFVRLLQNAIDDNLIDVSPEITVGLNPIIKGKAVIGNSGFGFVRDENNVPVRFPHIGGVTLRNNVEIGDFTTVCRGTLDDTFIDDDTKVDDHVHIAHNVHIGKRTMIVAGSIICGSVKIGDDCFIGGNCVIKEGLTIGNKVTIGMGAVVTKNVPDNTIVIGNPARKL